MKIPKGFVYFLVVIQGLILLGHYALYSAILTFFPALALYHLAILLILFVLSIAFLGLLMLTFRRDIKWVRPAEILSALWMPTWFYLLLASLLTIIVTGIWSVPVGPVALIFFGLAVLLAVYGVINARITRVVTIKVKLNNLPVFWKGKTAVMVSDLHLGHVLRQGFAKKIVKKINAIKPEIVFIPGDFYDGIKTDFAGLATVFKDVKSNQGIYFVTGNHEEIAGYKTCEHAIAAAGIHILENQMVEINGLQIAGLAYFSESRETPEHITTIINSLNLDKSKASILLKHVPNKIDVIAQTGISLQLSGHTHHGQVWPGRHFTKRVYKNFDYGLKSLGSYQIYTSSGAGTWGPPMRTFTKSEIVKIVFE